jgi:peroxiredoxin
MPKPTASLRRIVVTAVALAAIYGGYLLAMNLVRRHVDGKIEVTVGRSLPTFQLPTVAGTRVSSGDLAGKRVVLNFFRSRCHSCEAEAADVRAFAAANRDRSDVVVLGVLLDRALGFPEADTARTLERHAYVHPVLVADQAFVDAFHGVGWANVTPITYVTDAAGTIRHALRGKQTLAALQRTLE